MTGTDELHRTTRVERIHSHAQGINDSIYQIASQRRMEDRADLLDCNPEVARFGHRSYALDARPRQLPAPSRWPPLQRHHVMGGNRGMPAYRHFGSRREEPDVHVMIAATAAEHEGRLRIVQL